jgi:hypothetical protein
MSERHRRRLSRQRPERRRQRRGLLLLEPPLGLRSERRRPEPEEPSALGLQPLHEPGRRLLDPAVLGQALGQLFGGRRWIEVLEIRILSGEQRARLELQQSRDEYEELPARVEIELLTFGQPLQEGQHHAGHVHFGQVELVAKDERQQEVEGTLERLEVELELADGRHGGRR